MIKIGCYHTVINSLKESIIVVDRGIKDITEILKEREILQQLKSKMKILEGVLPICDHSEVNFSHGKGDLSYNVYHSSLYLSYNLDNRINL